MNRLLVAIERHRAGDVPHMGQDQCRDDRDGQAAAPAGQVFTEIGHGPGIHRGQEQGESRQVKHRAQGQEAAKGIQAIADRERTVILAEAERDAEILRGEGDARAIEIYADAFGKNQEYYTFYRSMIAYREALANSQDVLVLEPDSDFFKYFSDFSGQ